MTNSPNGEQYWLVRTKDLYLSRPMTSQELIKKIENGDLNPLDEICPGAGYWFGIHETEEVRRHLGDIDLSNLSSGLEVEITSSTETHPVRQTLILEMPKVAAGAAAQTTVVPLVSSTEPVLDLSARSTPQYRARPKEMERHWPAVLTFVFGFMILLIYFWSWSD